MNMIERVMNFSTYIIEMFIMIFYYGITLKQRKQSISKEIFVIIYLCSYIAWAFLKFPVEYWYMNTLVCVVITFGMTFLYTCKIEKKIIVAIIYFSIGIGTEILAVALVSAIKNTDYKEEYDVYCNVLSKLFMFLAILAIAIMFKKNIYVKDKNSLILMVSIPIVCSVSTLISVEYLLDVDNALFLTIQSILILFINIILFYMLNRISEETIYKEKKDNLEKQLLIQKEKYNKNIESYESISAIIHDINKHINYISELDEAKEYDKLEEYLKQIKKDIKENYICYKTKNIAVDSCVSHAQTLAKENNVEFSTEFKFNLDTINKVKDYDMCIILGNLLDNANENVIGCEEDNRKIKIKIVTDNIGIHILVRNTFNEEFKPHKKDNGKTNGYGISNVNSVVEKYNGIYTYEKENGEYCAYITIQIYEKEED